MFLNLEKLQQIFKRIWFLCLIYFSAVEGMGEVSFEDDNENTRLVSSDIVTPIASFPFRRWDFVARSTLERLSNNSGKFGYDAFGFPKFQSFWEYRLGLGDKILATTPYYRNKIIRKFGKEVQENPQRWKEILSKETIDNYLNGNFSKNPTLLNGDKLVVHHDRSGYRLVSEVEHRGKPHIGGNPIYGYKALNRFPKTYAKIIASRWMGFVGFDIAISSGIKIIEGESDLEPYIVDASIKVASGSVATLVELGLYRSSWFVSPSAPLFLMKSPIFVSKGLAKGLIIGGTSPGGPAAWAATAIYIATEITLRWVWNEYQLREAKRVESLCREAEFEVRKNYLSKIVRENTKVFKSLKGEF